VGLRAELFAEAKRLNNNGLLLILIKCWLNRAGSVYF